MKRNLLSVCFLLVTIFSCKKKEVVIPFDFSAFKTELQSIVNTESSLDSLSTLLTSALLENSYQPILSEKHGFSEAALILEKLNEMDNHGLSTYFLSLKNEWDSIQIKNDSLFNLAIKNSDYSKIAATELLARKTAITINKVIEFGAVNPNAVFNAHGFYVKTYQPDESWYLHQLAEQKPGSYTNENMPLNPRYAQLMKTYASMDFKKLSEEFEKVPSFTSRVLEEGDKYAGAQQLRKRLGMDLLADDHENVNRYDEQLVEAVKKFQSKYGLATDGVIGPSTLGLINKTPEEIKHQIEATLERFRWKTDIAYDNLLWVNLPEYALYVYEEGNLVQQHKVCVGINHSDYRTPEFIDTMEKIVVNPKWYLPRSIATLEVLPKAQENPYYLIDNNYKIYSGNTEISPFDLNMFELNPDNFPYRIEQGVGGGNSLGRIKFLFPNKYSIYLHDTPSKYMFNRDRRAVSHGCVRVQDPFRLGDYLLNGSKAYEKAKKSAETEVFLTNEKIHQVYISYYTTWVSEQNELQFRDDVYGRDQHLIAALLEKGVI